MSELDRIAAAIGEAMPWPRDPKEQLTPESKSKGRGSRQPTSLSDFQKPGFARVFAFWVATFPYTAAASHAGISETVVWASSGPCGAFSWLAGADTLGGRPRGRLGTSGAAARASCISSPWRTG